MQKSKLSPLTLLAFIAIVVLMAGVGWWLSGPTSPPVAIAPTAKVTAPAPPRDTTPAARRPSLAPVFPTGSNAAVAVAPMQPVADASNAADQVARDAADLKIGIILAQTNGVEATRDKLLLLFPGMNNYEKIAAAPHLVNLVMDPELPRLLPFLKNPTTPVEAMETIFNDMLNRPPQVGWPVLIDVAGNPKHPFSARAKELLTTIVGEDYGTDIVAWRQGMLRQLEQQGIKLDAAGNVIPEVENAPPPAAK